MIKKLNALKLVAGIVCVNFILISSPAKAEWDWPDRPSIEKKMTEYIKSKLLDENLPVEEVSVAPELCKDVKFGYQDLVYADDINVWKYFSSFQNINLECWERLKQVIPPTPFKIREAKTVAQIKYFPFADSGPTILFIFDKNADYPR